MFIIGLIYLKQAFFIKKGGIVIIEVGDLLGIKYYVERGA